MSCCVRARASTGLKFQSPKAKSQKNSKASNSKAGHRADEARSRAGAEERISIQFFKPGPQGRPKIARCLSTGGVAGRNESRRDGRASVVPTGLFSWSTANPALKCWAIFKRSLPATTPSHDRPHQRTVCHSRTVVDAPGAEKPWDWYLQFVNLFGI